VRLEVTPAGAVDDLGDRLPADTEERAEVHRALATGGPVPYLANLISGESGCSYPLTNRLSALRVPVGHVVVLGPEEQMGGVHAQRLVAAVQDALARRDRSVGIFVGNPVSADEATTAPHLSVPTSVRGPRPEDAVVHDGMVAG